MNENVEDGDRFSPDNADVAEVTEVLGVTQEGLYGNTETTFVEETTTFTPPAAPIPANPTPPAPSAAYTQPAPAPQPFSQAPPYPQGPQNHGAPQGAYANPGQPFAGAQQYGGVYVEEVPWSDKSKLAAGLFGILLGTFGVHNFYLGYTGKAVAQLLITILSFGLLSFVSAIWGLVEGILILSASVGTQWDLDAQGLPMRPIGASGA